MQHHKQPIVTDILTTANKLHNQNDVEPSIQWIPGNDRADKLAKQGTCKTQHDKQVSYATSKQIIQTKSRKIWHDRWARGNTGRSYYQHQQTDSINQLHRAHQTAIFRLRTHHIPLNAHLHHIASRKVTQKSVSTAPTVMRPLNISYSTAHCTTTSEPDYFQLNRIYYGSTTQVQRTATYNMSAMNRRDKIVQSLREQES